MPWPLGSRSVGTLVRTLAEDGKTRAEGWKSDHLCHALADVQMTPV